MSQQHTVKLIFHPKFQFRFCNKLSGHSFDQIYFEKLAVQNGMGPVPSLLFFNFFQKCNPIPWSKYN